MAWKVKRSPTLPAIPTFQHHNRCANCGHLEKPDLELSIHEHHDPEVGCMVEGGTKYIENEEGHGVHVCSCSGFVPVVKGEEIKHA